MDIWDITDPNLEPKVYGIVIPFGSEESTIYKRYNVVKHMATQLGVSRIVIITRGKELKGRDNTFVKNQLLSIWKCFSFEGCSSYVNIQFPIAGIKERRDVDMQPLSSGATAIVQDHVFDCGIIRQLVFSDKIQVIQSAMEMKQTSSALVKQNPYACLVSMMLEACKDFETKPAPRLLLLGLGGGVMATAAVKKYPSARVVAVEKEPVIMKVGVWG